MSSLNLASLFPGAITEHLGIIAQLEAQQKAMASAAQAGGQ